MRYAEYRPTSTTWVESIPVTWDCKKISALFSQRKTNVSDKDYPALSVTKIGIVPQLDTAAKTDAGDNRKLVCTNDFVINSRSDRKGSCGVSELDGSVSLINIVLTPRQEWNNRYVHYLLRCQPFSEEYYRYGRGIVSDLWTTRYSEMKNILLPVPPRTEQDQIVRYLDWQVSKINKLIAAKKKQISILKNVLQANIEVQLHAYDTAESVRLKSLGKLSKGGGFSRDNLIEETSYPAILYGDIYTQYTYKTDVSTHFIDEAAYNASHKIIKGDIVLAGTGETKDEIGKPILYSGDDIVAVGGDVIVFHPNNDVCSEYVLYQLYSQAALFHRFINGKGDIIVHISPAMLGNTTIELPSEEEQKTAVEKIKLVIKRVYTTVKAISDEIDVLHEYRTRLISDVVTGQIDVRNIEIPDFEMVEENDEFTDEEDVSDEAEEQEE